jgi:hypothetical protein
MFNLLFPFLSEKRCNDNYAIPNKNDTKKVEEFVRCTYDNGIASVYI